MFMTPEQMAIREIQKICDELQKKQDDKRIKAGVPSYEYLCEIRDAVWTVGNEIDNMIDNCDYWQGEEETESTQRKYVSGLVLFIHCFAELNELWSKYDEECKK